VQVGCEVYPVVHDSSDWRWHLPERLDPAVAGLRTRGRHSTSEEALRLETPRSGTKPSPVLALYRPQPSSGILRVQAMCDTLPNLPEPQLNLRAASPIVVTRHRDQGPGLRKSLYQPTSCHLLPAPDTSSYTSRQCQSASPDPRTRISPNYTNVAPLRSSIPKSSCLWTLRGSRCGASDEGSSLPFPDRCRYQRSSANAEPHRIEPHRRCDWQMPSLVT
jgi:hypothetical protein